MSIKVKKEFIHPDSESYEKLELGDFINIKKLLPPDNLIVIVKMNLYCNENLTKRMHMADSIFDRSRGWKIFDNFFEMPKHIDYEIIEWSWSPISGKPKKFLVKDIF